MIDPVPRYYSWTDVETTIRDHLDRVGWPNWLVGASAYLGDLELTIQPSNRQHVGAWLAVIFGPRLVSNDGEFSIALEGLTSNSRRLVVSIEEAEGPGALPPRLLFDAPPRIARTAESAVDEATLGLPPIVAFHSFKGGVGRTTAAIALALELSNRESARVLLIDADLEAPGITYLLDERLPDPPVSFADFLALAHEDLTNEAANAIALTGVRLRDSLLDSIFVLPAFRPTQAYERAQVRPEHLIRNSQDPFIFSRLVGKLGKELTVDCVVIDLRAGLSEVSAGLVLDPTVRRVFVTTLGGQSLKGTAAILERIRRSDESWPSTVRDRAQAITIVFSQVRQEQRDALLDAQTQLLSLAARETATGSLGARVIQLGYSSELLHLSRSWTECRERIVGHSLGTQLRPVADVLSARDSAQSAIPALDDFRKKLHSESAQLEFAEAGRGYEFLLTQPLVNLASDHRRQLPIVAVVGKKGAGKSYTFLSLLRCATWRGYLAKTVGEGDTDAEGEAGIYPLLAPANLHDQAAQVVVESRARIAFPSDRARVDEAYIKDVVRDGLTGLHHEGEWRGLWLGLIAQALGGVDDQDLPELETLPERDEGRAVVLVDGLEDLFQDIWTDKAQQTALRSLLQDVPAWLAQIPGRPIGLVVFVRQDMVTAAIRQNAAQFLHRFAPYELRWGRVEALKLVLWIATKVGYPKAASSSVYDEVDLAFDLIPLWGLKLGSRDSREAYTADWVLAALSDFRGQVQARDLVRLLKFASAGSVDGSWNDRALVPQALRKSIEDCGREKVKEFELESPRLREIFAKMRSASDTDRVVPFAPQALGLTIEELELLEQSGIALREDDGYYMPETFRHGLGFALPKGARPRVIALARRVADAAKRSGLGTA